MCFFSHSSRCFQKNTFFFNTINEIEKYENNSLTYDICFFNLSCENKSLTVYMYVQIFFISPSGVIASTTTPRPTLPGTTPNPSQVYVRLVSRIGRPENEGRVEVYANGQWGTVCSGRRNRWSTPDSNVVCSMIGYGR